MDEENIEKMARQQEERVNKLLEYSEKMTRKQEERVNRIMEDAERASNRGPSLFSNLLLLVLFNLIVLGMAAGTLFFGWRGYTITSNGETTTARVVELSEFSDEDGCCVYSPVFEYTVNGRRHTFEGLNASDPPAYRVGQEVEIIYNVNNPNEAAVNSFSELWLVASVLCGSTLILAVVLNGLVFARMRGGRST